MLRQVWSIKRATSSTVHSICSRWGRKEVSAREKRQHPAGATLESAQIPEQSPWTAKRGQRERPIISMFRLVSQVLAAHLERARTPDGPSRRNLGWGLRLHVPGVRVSPGCGPAAPPRGRPGCKFRKCPWQPRAAATPRRSSRARRRARIPPLVRRGALACACDGRRAASPRLWTLHHNRSATSDRHGPIGGP